MPTKKTDRRKWLLRVQNGLCAYCRHRMVLKWGFRNSVTIDRITPGGLGGTYCKLNTVGACNRCNNLKANLTVMEFFRRYGKHLSNPMFMSPAIGGGNAKEILARRKEKDQLRRIARATQD